VFEESIRGRGKSAKEENESVRRKAWSLLLGRVK